MNDMASADESSMFDTYPGSVPAVEVVHRSRFVDVDGIRTHYLEAGEGYPLVLLHSGEFGASAELSWEYVIPALAQQYRVIAPDWLGFGQTDKVHDFVSKSDRMMRHMARFLEVLAIDRAYFVANSMGATRLLAAAARVPTQLPIEKLVAISGGGQVPDNEHRQAMVTYECTREGMVKILRAMFIDPVWYSDEEYITRRYEASREPGAWEAAAAARLKNPTLPQQDSLGGADTTPYEQVKVPSLVIAGSGDKLRVPGYATEIAARIPQGKAIVMDSGHCPNIERPSEIARYVLEFLAV